MPAYIVIFDIQHEADRSAILKYISRLSGVRLSDTAYVIKSNETINEVKDRLRLRIGPFDPIFVFKADSPYAGFGPDITHRWLERNLTD